MIFIKLQIYIIIPEEGASFAVVPSIDVQEFILYAAILVVTCYKRAL